MTPLGEKFAKALAKFIGNQRKSFALELTKSKYEQEKKWNAYGLDPLDLSDGLAKGGKAADDMIHTKAKVISAAQFTIWTSMLKRSTETANDFDVDDYDIKVKTG